ncbi:MAG: winged helix-turn-helix domain-containing protein [Acidobacteria bacterium]|nr:winged helix-turn-helix domain-containing protein [Acidobacteriota bacterium]MCB9397914.1 winged helix-turn-helix domain-containing protein [Acidobacteriota bacterium]
MNPLTFQGAQFFSEQDKLVYADGSETILRPQVSLLLKVFLQNPGKTLSKDQIFEHVWPDRVVSEASLFKLIQELRTELAGHLPDSELIKTIPKRGYQWLGGLETVKPTVSNPTYPPTHFRLFSLMGILFLFGVLGWYFWPQPAPKPSTRTLIAVLPFQAETEGKEYAWMPYGLADVLNQILAESQSINVLSFSRVIAFDQGGGTLDDLKRNFQVSHVLRSKIQQVEASWTLHFEMVPLENGAAIQGDLSGEHPVDLVRQLAYKVIQRLYGESLRFEAFLSPNAYVNETYAKGCNIFQKESSALAKPYFQICVDQDPSFLWGRLRLAQSLLAEGQVARFRVEIGSVIQAAEQRDWPLLEAFARAERAAIACDQGDCAAGIADLEQAESIYQRLNHPVGLVKCKMIEAYRLAMQGAELSTLLDIYTQLQTILDGIGDRVGSVQVQANRAVITYQMGQIQAALDLFEHTKSLAQTLNMQEIVDIVDNNLSQAWIEVGEFQKSIQLLTTLREKYQATGDAQLELQVSINLAKAFFHDQQEQEARTMLEETLALARKIGHKPIELESLCWLTRLHLYQGEEIQARLTLNLAQAIPCEPNHPNAEHRALLQAWLQPDSKPSLLKTDLSQSDPLVGLVAAHQAVQQGRNEAAIHILQDLKNQVGPLWKPGMQIWLDTVLAAKIGQPIQLPALFQNKEPLP